MLDYYYDLYRKKDGEDTDNIHEFCHNYAFKMNREECIQLIEEVFKDIFNAIVEYEDEYKYDLIDTFKDHTFKNYVFIYNILACFTMNKYITEKLNEDYHIIEIDIKPDMTDDDWADIANLIMSY
jgi:hypothetical protein